MSATPSPEPPLDRRWLEMLAECCARVAGPRLRVEDLYLERALEVRVSASAVGPRVEMVRCDGAAARWRRDGRLITQAATGVGPRTLARRLADHPAGARLATARPLPPSELDPPRDLFDWARAVLDRLAGPSTVVRYLERRAVVVRDGSWLQTGGPPLVQVEGAGEDGAGLLATWGHPRLERWLRCLGEAAPPGRCFSPEPGLQPPVLLTEGTAGVLLHELVGHLVEGDLAVSAASPLCGLAGALLTCPTLELADDPTRLDLPGGFTADDEGVPAAAMRVLAGGRLVGWLCDRDAAARLGMAPGRGRRSGWSRPPVARLSNRGDAAGTTSREALENGVGSGLVVTRLGGAVVDPVSRRAVLRVERGWELRHGRRRRPLARCELTGDVLDVLAHLDPAIGDDPTPEWRLGWCVKDGLPLPTGSEAPTVLVHRLEVL